MSRFFTQITYIVCTVLLVGCCSGFDSITNTASRVEPPRALFSWRYFYKDKLFSLLLKYWLLGQNYNETEGNSNALGSTNSTKRK
uniref:Secreted protein n=1 Tax=Strongyloides venezuelensis TaxID=75913 RepID=A0A0K0G324_STRVS